MSIDLKTLKARVTPAILLLTGIMALALLIRLVPITFSITGNGVILPEFDPYYHMRRIAFTVDHFPVANIFDSYVDFPNGFMVGWPPLFDLLAATLSIIVGFGSPDRFTIELASSFLPVIIGVLSIVPLYYIVKDALGGRTAMLAAFIMAVLPASVFRTIFGFVDHHGLEVLISLSMFLLFTRAVSSARKDNVTLKSVTKSKRTLAYATLAGLASALMIFTWDGAPIFISIILLYAFVQYAYDAYKKQDTEYLTIAGIISMLSALIIVAPFAATSYMGQQFKVSALYLSWFHIVFIAACAAFFLLLGLLSNSSKKLPWYFTPVTAIAGAAVAVIALKLALPGFFSGIEQGVSFLLGGGEVLSTVAEVESLLFKDGAFSLDVVWMYYNTAAVLAIIGIVAFGYHILKNRNSLQPVDLFMVIWTLVILGLGILQQRFIYLLAVNVAVYAGYTLYLSMKAVGLDGFLAKKPEPVKKQAKKKASTARSASMPPALVAVLMFVAVLMAPLLLNTLLVATAQEPYSASWNDACTWVRDNTPATSGVYNDNKDFRPEYGIMCWWDYGNFILYRAERPAVANNFQTGIKDSGKFFIAQNESDANAIMDKRNAKYVMIDDRMASPYAGDNPGIFYNIPYLAGDDPESYDMIYFMPVPYGSSMGYDGTAKYYNCMLGRLLYDEGFGGATRLGASLDGLGHYRLVYNTSGSDKVKVFEYVKGAVIEGTATPGHIVTITLNATTPGGHKTYQASQVAGHDGRYSFTVPYATASQGFVKTDGAYALTSGSSTTTVVVPEEAITGGRTVTAGGL